jgi:hypothetical protein
MVSFFQLSEISAAGFLPVKSHFRKFKKLILKNDLTGKYTVSGLLRAGMACVIHNSFFSDECYFKTRCYPVVYI